MKVWIDGDACPRMVKDLIFKACEKQNFYVTLVANQYITIPRSSKVDMVVVEKKFDEADFYIIENSEPNDIVITADIPLASELVDKGVLTINPRGNVYTPENVKEALSVRNLMQELRGGGIIKGGPPPLGPKDKQKFANSFQKELVKKLNALKS